MGNNVSDILRHIRLNNGGHDFKAIAGLVEQMYQAYRDVLYISAGSVSDDVDSNTHHIVELNEVRPLLDAFMIALGFKSEYVLYNNVEQRFDDNGALIWFSITRPEEEKDIRCLARGASNDETYQMTINDQPVS